MQTDNQLYDAIKLDENRIITVVCSKDGMRVWNS